MPDSLEVIKARLDRWWYRILQIEEFYQPRNSIDLVHILRDLWYHIQVTHVYYRIKSNFLVRTTSFPHPSHYHLDTKKLCIPVLYGLLKARLEGDVLLATMDSEKQDMPAPKMEAEEVGLKTVLMCTQSLFENRTSLPDRVFDKLMETGKKVLVRSQRDASVR